MVHTRRKVVCWFGRRKLVRAAARVLLVLCDAYVCVCIACMKEDEWVLFGPPVELGRYKPNKGRKGRNKKCWEWNGADKRGRQRKQGQRLGQLERQSTLCCWAVARELQQAGRRGLTACAGETRNAG